MAEASSSSASQTQQSSSHITEDEASLYDRQIRLWGLEAQNRMRSSTVLILSLRSLAHETIKNLVLAGIGRMIVMDDGVVTEEDLGSGFLFREEERAVGKERTAAALPQIASLNPLVSLTALPTLAPFVRDASGGAEVDSQEEMVEFLQREKVDVIVACDLATSELETIDSAARRAGSKFYGAGTYGFYGYVFADLGEQHEYVYQPPTKDAKVVSLPVKRTSSYAPLSSVLDRSNWSLAHGKSAQGGSPFRGLTKSATKNTVPSAIIGILAVWAFEREHSRLPSSSTDTQPFSDLIIKLREELGVSAKSFADEAGQEPYDTAIEHLSQHASHFFPPTLAIMGGFLAQDVLRALSLKDTPITNLLVVDSLEGTGTVTRWGMSEPVQT